MLPRHTLRARPAALSYGGAQEVAGPGVVLVPGEVAVLLIQDGFISSPVSNSDM